MCGLPVLWVIRRLVSDRSLMGAHALSGAGRIATGAVLVLLTVCVTALAWLSF
jgi:hypothetical protein